MSQLNCQSRAVDDAATAAARNRYLVSAFRVDGAGNGGLAVLAFSPAVKQIVVVDGDVTYIGEALPGTATTAAKWRVKRITVDGSTTTIEFALNADDIADFDQVWDDGAGTDWTDLDYG